MNEKFEAFIEPARNRQGWVRLILGIVFLCVFYFVSIFVVLGIAGLFYARWYDMDSLDGFAEASNALASMDVSADAMVLLLATFVGMFAAAWLTVLLFRRKGLRSLIGPGQPGRYFLLTSAILAPVVVALFVLNLLSADITPNLPVSDWIMWMPLALPLLLIQVSAEELIFRGYLMQELATRFQSRWLWMVLPSAVFGAMHYSPDEFGSNALLVVLATGFFGWIAADLTVRTGNLGAAIALHFFNNFMAMMLVSLSGALSGLSLYKTTVHVSDEAAVRTLLFVDIGLMIVLYTIYLLVLRRRERR